MSREQERWWGAELVALDLEMTGLDVVNDRICEIGVVSGHRGRIHDRWSTMVNPGRESSPGAQAVHQIPPDDLSEAPRFEQVVDEVASRIEGKVCVAHRAEVDRGFLEAAFARCGRPFPEVRWVDTLTLARAVLSLRSNRLETLARGLVGADVACHRALSDAEAAWGVLHGLMALADPDRRWLVGDLIDPSRVLDPARTSALEVLRARQRTGEPVGVVYLSRDASGRWRRTLRRVVVQRIRLPRLHVYCHLRSEDRVFRLERVHGLVEMGAGSC